MHHRAQLIFVFLVETGFHHVVQDGLELRTSGDPPALVSQSAGITGLSHCARPILATLNIIILCFYYQKCFLLVNQMIADGGKVVGS